MLNRRGFLRLLAVATSSPWISGCGGLPLARSPSSEPSEPVAADLLAWLQTYGPYFPNANTETPAGFFGDNPSRGHRLRDGFPAAGAIARDPDAEVVIVGGGMSGLLTAYTLRDLKPLVLESNPRFGGNAQGEVWNGIEYSCGAAYCGMPKPGSELFRLFEELDLFRLGAEHSEPEAYLLDEQFEKDLGKKIPAFRRFSDYLHKIADKVPDIPAYDPASRAKIDVWDKESVHEHLERILGNLHPVVRHSVEAYCWSAGAAPAAELSAAVGLAMLAGDSQGVFVARGGNPQIAARVLARSATAIGTKNFRAGATVFRIEPKADAVDIFYEHPDGGAHVVTARKVVVTCPKFIASRLLSLEPDRVALIREISYRPYLVANCLIQKRPKAAAYDLYALSAKRWEYPTTQAAWEALLATDSISSTAWDSTSDRGVLTLYRAIPIASGRAWIGDERYPDCVKQFRKQLERTWLPAYGLSAQDIASIRITRWGHPIPVATTGSFRKQLVDRVRRPFGKNVYFVQQDNWLMPSFETAAHEALHWSTEIRHSLKVPTAD